MISTVAPLPLQKSRGSSKSVGFARLTHRCMRQDWWISAHVELVLYDISVSTWYLLSENYEKTIIYEWSDLNVAKMCIFGQINWKKFFEQWVKSKIQNQDFFRMGSFSKELRAHKFIFVPWGSIRFLGRHFFAYFGPFLHQNAHFWAYF